MLPSHHRTAYSWQKSRNLIERNKIPSQREIRIVSVCEPWRHVRSSLYANSFQGCCWKWDRETEKIKRWMEYIAIPSLLWAPLPGSHHLHHCCRVITFLRKMRFAVPRRVMISFNLSYWSAHFQNSNQAFLSLLFEGLSYLMCKCCWLWTCPVPVLIGHHIGAWATWGGSFPSSMLKVRSTSISQGQIGLHCGYRLAFFTWAVYHWLRSLS